MAQEGHRTYAKLGSVHNKTQIDEPNSLLDSCLTGLDMQPYLKVLGMVNCRTHTHLILSYSQTQEC